MVNNLCIFSCNITTICVEIEWNVYDSLLSSDYYCINEENVSQHFNIFFLLLAAVDLSCLKIIQSAVHLIAGYHEFT